MQVRGRDVELVEERLTLGSLELVLVRPRDSEELLDEEAFEQEEYLPYWAELCPCSLPLAPVAGQLRPTGSVVELGCGLGLPSIVAALGGAAVTATDWSSDALAFAERNAERNGAELQTLLVSWGDPSSLVARA